MSWRQSARGQRIPGVAVTWGGGGERTCQAQLFEGVDAAGLQQLAHDAVGLLQTALQQQDAAALLSKGHGGGAAHDARAHDDDVGLVVLAAAHVAVVLGADRLQRSLGLRHWPRADGGSRRRRGGGGGERRRRGGRHFGGRLSAMKAPRGRTNAWSFKRRWRASTGDDRAAAAFPLLATRERPS